ncbi:MAG: hypothetical protein R3191_03580 [Anaerolineales bacterium]|nr:hypothetical protein [Anaerolineales bacterium]
MRNPFLRLMAATALMILLLVPHSPAEAEGPGTGGRRVMLQDEEAGPYLLRVVTSPTPPRVENLYLEIRVEDRQTGETLTDLDVYTQAEPHQGDAETVSAQAVHDIAPIPTEYAAHLPVTEAGVWRVTVQVDGPQGPAEVSFLTRVSGSTAVGTVVAVGLPIAGLALLIGVFVWLQRSSEENGADND